MYISFVFLTQNLLCTYLGIRPHLSKYILLFNLDFVILVSGYHTWRLTKNREQSSEVKFSGPKFKMAKT